MTEKEKLLILMSICEVANSRQETILQMLEDFEEISIDKLLNNQAVVSVLSQEEFHKLATNYDKRQLDSIIENMTNSDIVVLTVFDPRYPKSLLDLPDRPLILYAKGDIDLLNEDCFAIVGTRTPSNYGKIVADRFAEKLALGGLVIVSGLGYGVDSISHRKALEVGGKTIAVLGSGFSHIYPATNTALANEIAEKGLLLSEYPPSFTPKRYTFPKRNRIVAGLSKGVLIPEASIKSGTIYTKEFAIEYGKDVFAVPGSILSEKSELPNHLIKTAQAECVVDAEEILKFYGRDANKQTKAVQLSFDEKIIVDLLKTGEKDFDFLAENSKIPVNILNSYLTTLEISGLIRRLPAQTFALA